MSKNGYEINYTEKTIIATKNFLKEAGTVGSTAYNTLTRLRNELSDFRVVPREINKKPGKKTYGKLTYKVMGDFIAAQEEENATAVLAEFERVQMLSKVQSGSYAYVKTWFLNRYKDVFKPEDSQEAAA